MELEWLDHRTPESVGRLRLFWQPKFVLFFSDNRISVGFRSKWEAISMGDKTPIFRWQKSHPGELLQAHRASRPNSKRMDRSVSHPFTPFCGCFYYSLWLELYAWSHLRRRSSHLLAIVRRSTIQCEVYRGPSQGWDWGCQEWCGGLNSYKGRNREVCEDFDGQWSKWRWKTKIFEGKL